MAGIRRKLVPARAASKQQTERSFTAAATLVSGARYSDTEPWVVNSSGLRTVPLDARLGVTFNSALMIMTLWIGSSGRPCLQLKDWTDGKQLLGHQVIDEHTLQPLGFARMFFMRGLLVALIMWFAGLLLVVPAIALLLMPFFRQDKATIWEVVSGSRVVYSQ